MNFLIDANLPRRMVDIFRERGHHAIHTMELPDGNAASDWKVLQYAEEQHCVITTKDSDFTTFSGLMTVPKNCS